MRSLVCLFSLLLLSTFGSAQTFSVGLATFFSGLIEPEFSVSELSFNDVKLEARLAGGISGPLELGFGVSYRNSFGPIGTVLLAGQADLLTDGHFQAVMRAEGVIAAVAGSVEAQVFNRPAAGFRSESAFSRDALWDFGETLSMKLKVTARYRLDRSSILDGKLDLFYLFDAGPGGELSTRYNLIRLLERDDGMVMAKLYGSPGLTSGYGAVGFGYNVNRSDWPDLQGELWLAAGSKGFWPGLVLELSEDLEESQSLLGFTVRLEPYQINSPYLSALAYLEQAIDNGNLRLALGVLGDTESYAGLVKISYSFDLVD